MKTIRRIVYGLIVFVPIVLSAQANFRDGIDQAWPAAAWTLALVFWGLGSLLWMGLCAGVAGAIGFQLDLLWRGRVGALGPIARWC